MLRRMKKTTLLLASATLATISLTTSCSDYDNGFDEAMIRYNQNFIDRFGNIDPNQDWNLVRQLAEKNGGGKTTRAYDYGDITENENAPERNLWPKYREGTTETDKKYLMNLEIPGFPDSKGTFYYEKNGANVYAQTAPVDEVNPIGDVTDEEIIYVSQWFRTHRYPQSLKAEWRNFFLQDISHDCDREISEDGSTCDAGKRIIERPIYSYNGSPIGTSDNPKYPMNQLISKTLNGGWNHLYNFNYDSGNHLQNYETAPRFTDFSSEGTASITNYATTDGYQPTARTIQLYIGIGTDDFAYYGSFDSQWHRKYVLVHLQFTIKQSGGLCKIHNDNCAEHSYDGYYLGFDYESYEELYDTNGDLDKYLYFPRDGFYSNWIVKISHTSWGEKEEETTTDDPNPDEDEEDPVPAHTIKDQGLIVCEDLGDCDFDFNDVVLKVQHIHEEGKKDQLRITAMAAGGALPSNIFYKDKEVEVGENKTSEIHKLLNREAPHIINAGEEFGQEGRIWYIPIDDTDLKNLEEENATTPNKYPGFATYAFDKGFIRVKVNNEKWIESVNSEYKDVGSTYTDKRAEKVPQMMFLPVSFLWPRETIGIDEAYGKEFASWVSNAENTGWYKRSHANINLVTQRNVAGSGSEYTGLLRWPDVEGEQKPIDVNLGEDVFVNFYGEGPIEIANSSEIISAEYVGNNTIKITGKIVGEKEIHIKGPKNIIKLYVTVTYGNTLKWSDVDGDTKTINVPVGGESVLVTYLGQGEIQSGEKDYNHNLIQVNNKGNNTLEIVSNQNNNTGETDVYIKASKETDDSDDSYIILHVVIEPNKNILGWPPADDVNGNEKNIGDIYEGETVKLEYYGSLSGEYNNDKYTITYDNNTHILTIKINALQNTSETVEFQLTDGQNNYIKLKMTLKKKSS